MRLYCFIIFLGDYVNKKYLSSAFLLVVTSVVVKVIGAVYKIPLTAFIGAVGRGYFAIAYNLYLPVHAIVLGAFPVALSRLVSKYSANNNSAMLFSLRKASRRIFFLAGLVGMIVILAVAVPYSRLVVNSPKSIYTILVLSPSILFSSLSSSYQDYYKGLMDMKPTAISQLIDAGFKMIFGLVFARLSMLYLYNGYLQNASVLGNVVSDDAQALSLIYPFTSAFAMLGACLGSLFSLCFSFLYDLINGKRNVDYNILDVKSAQSELVGFAFPIMISCAVQSLFQFLDTTSIQLALNRVDIQALQSYFSYAVIDEKDLTTYAYGLFSASLDFKNLVIGITMSLGICAVPAISREQELGNSKRLSELINSVYKYTSLLSLFGGVLLSLYSFEILNLFYGNSQDIVIGSCDLVKWFGATIVCYSMAGTAVNVVQAVGCPEKSIKAYVVSGVIRVVLNFILVQNEKLLLYGAVISGAIGYLVMTAWNIAIVIKTTKMSFDVRNIVLKPVFAVAVTYYISNLLYKITEISSNQIINILLKLAISTTIFCILCFSLKLLKFNRKILRSNVGESGVNT